MGAIANLDSANLNKANLSNSILSKIDLRQAQNLTIEQLTFGDSPPLICGASLPEEWEIEAHRDWDRLAPVLHERYPLRFETLEEAEAWVNEQRPQ